jgi:hypothetical protein
MTLDFVSLPSTEPEYLSTELSKVTGFDTSKHGYDLTEVGLKICTQLLLQELVKDFGVGINIKG